MNGSINDYLKGIEGNRYTWSFHAFKEWKKAFHREYKERTGKNFKESVPFPGDREAIYKRIFGMEGIDVFENLDTNNTTSRVIDEELLKTCNEISSIL